jgi:hypothetical protein
MDKTKHIWVLQLLVDKNIKIAIFNFL